MKRALVVILLTFSLFAGAVFAQSTSAAAPSAAGGDFWSGVKAAIERNLGRPYVWGATGLKSYDCSGFLWRVLFENGILVKRTTARKFYMMLQPVDKKDQWKFGTVVFFDDLKHVGIIESEKTFYHAQTSVGTNRSDMNGFWKNKIYGFRQLPTSAGGLE